MFFTAGKTYGNVLACQAHRALVDARKIRSVASFSGVFLILKIAALYMI